MKTVLLLPKISIQNANALSSPYTIGFPAMTAWLGGVHALQRKLNAGQFPDLAFTSTAVVSHEINLHTYKGRGDYVHSIIGTSNPLGKDGGRPSFIESPRCHLTVSLVVECEGVSAEASTRLLAAVTHALHAGLKLAGGDIIRFNAPSLLAIDSEKAHQQLMRKLMPGHVLIERRDLLIDAMASGRDAIDGLLDYLKVTTHSDEAGEGPVEWRSEKKSLGWIVPIATGFQAISKLGHAERQRDADTPHRFAESVVTLGEFKMPYRIKALNDMLWHYHVDAEKALYLCQQNNRRLVSV